MADTARHLSDNEFAADDGDERDSQRVREHIQACEACRQRREPLVRLRKLLAATGQRERRPVRDVVPSAMMRLRLRRHSITNANELLEGFAAFMRGLGSLFSLPTTDQRFIGRGRGAEEEHHE